MDGQGWIGAGLIKRLRMWRADRAHRRTCSRLEAWRIIEDVPVIRERAMDAQEGSAVRAQQRTVAMNNR